MGKREKITVTVILGWYHQLPELKGNMEEGTNGNI
jgi:hypothetical protein